MLTKLIFSCLGALCLVFLSLFASAQQLSLRPVVIGLERPLWMEQIPQTQQFVILQQWGPALVWDREQGSIQETAFLDLGKELGRANEQGVLCLVFEPNFAQSQRFYLYYTNKKNDVVIERWQAQREGETWVANPESREEILNIEQPYRNHNGGWMGFGPDGYLYISVGDGGAANDPKNKAQDLSSLLGKILRIDVRGEKSYRIPADNPFARGGERKPVEQDLRQGEIWAWGLRNAWRCSWDSKTKNFWIADVGQNRFEEISALPHAKVKGANFGWRLREGFIATPKRKVGGERPENNVDPLYAYSHGAGEYQGLSVTGGFVYRGKKIPALEGQYLFADYQVPRIWALDGKLKEGEVREQSQVRNLSAMLQAGLEEPFAYISSFVEDDEGELYLIDHAGTVFALDGE